MTQEPKIKGAAVREFVSWYQRTHGAERLARVIASVPPEVQATLQPDDARLGILAGSWYPSAHVHAMLDAMTAGMTPAETQRMAREGAHSLMKGTLSGVYRLLFEAMMTPEKYARDAQKLFSRYYNTGVMTKIVTGPTSHLTTVRDWTSHHPILCDLLVYTGEAVYDALGCQGVLMKKTACVAQGAPECTFVITWRE